MDIVEYQNVLKELMQTAESEEREQVYIRGGNFLLANIKNRIQKNGEDTLGKKMLPYSQKPIYVKRDQFVKKGAFKARGKTGTKTVKVFNISTKKGKNIAITNEHRERKTMYLENGYKQFRDIQGRQTQHRDLTLSGNTMLSYVLGVDENAVVIGFNQRKAADNRYYLELENNAKIFSASQKEINEFNKFIVEAQLEIISKIYQ